MLILTQHTRKGNLSLLVKDGKGERRGFGKRTMSLAYIPPSPVQGSKFH